MDVITICPKTYAWVRKEIYLRFDEEQYNELLKGYQPHWDMRFGIYFEISS